jgi:hypothetical protein
VLIHMCPGYCMAYFLGDPTREQHLRGVVKSLGDNTWSHAEGEMEKEGKDVDICYMGDALLS